MFQQVRRIKRSDTHERDQERAQHDDFRRIDVHASSDYRPGNLLLRFPGKPIARP